MHLHLAAHFRYPVPSVICTKVCRLHRCPLRRVPTVLRFLFLEDIIDSDIIDVDVKAVCVCVTASGSSVDRTHV